MSRNPWLRPAGAEGLIPVDVLWDRFAALYGSRWRGLFPDDASRVAWREEMAAVMYERGIKYVMVKPALEKMRKALNADVQPPGIAEFADLCLPRFDFEGAYIEAREQSQIVELGMAKWSDPAIYWAARDFGFYRVVQTPWSRAKGEWTRLLCNRLQACPQIPVKTEVAYVRGDMSLARETLAALKSSLAGVSGIRS